MLRSLLLVLLAVSTSPQAPEVPAASRAVRWRVDVAAPIQAVSGPLDWSRPPAPDELEPHAEAVSGW